MWTGAKELQHSRESSSLYTADIYIGVMIKQSTKPQLLVPEISIMYCFRHSLGTALYTCCISDTTGGNPV